MFRSVTGKTPRANSYSMCRPVFLAISARRKRIPCTNDDRPESKVSVARLSRQILRKNRETTIRKCRAKCSMFVGLWSSVDRIALSFTPSIRGNGVSRVTRVAVSPKVTTVNRAGFRDNVYLRSHESEYLS